MNIILNIHGFHVVIHRWFRGVKIQIQMVFRRQGSNTDGLEERRYRRQGLEEKMFRRLGSEKRNFRRLGSE